MNFRKDPIYVSSEVWRWLWLLAKAEKSPPENESYSHDAGMPVSTPDAIADQILRQAIREQHPQLPEHQKKLENMERELIKILAR